MQWAVESDVPEEVLKGSAYDLLSLSDFTDFTNKDTLLREQLTALRALRLFRDRSPTRIGKLQGPRMQARP